VTPLEELLEDYAHLRTGEAPANTEYRDELVRRVLKQEGVSPVSKTELKKLGTIIGKLEGWQIRNARHDPAGEVRAAKDHLLRLLRDLERETPNDRKERSS
jgi:hypothetical protein